MWFSFYFWALAQKRKRDYMMLHVGNFGGGPGKDNQLPLATFLTLFAWFSILFSGKFPEFCAEGIVGVIAYWNRVAGYALLLVTDEYPTFSL